MRSPSSHTRPSGSATPSRRSLTLTAGLTVMAVTGLLAAPSAFQTDRPVAALIGDLSAPTPEVRTAAACALRDQGSAAAPALAPLTRLLADGAPVPAQTCGARWRGRFGDDETTPGEQAAAALVAIGSPAFDPLVTTLGSQAWIARRNAVWALGALRDRRAVQPLAGITRDTESPVRQQVAWALGALDDSAAVTALLPLLRDPDAGVRRQAAWALGAIDDRRAVEGLVAALRDTDAEVREQSAWALGAIDDRAAVQPLVAVLSDQSPRVRKQAAWALGAIDDGAAVDGLVKALRDDDPGVREQAAWALGAIGDTRALPGLLAILKDTNASVRRQAAWAVGVVSK